MTKQGKQGKSPRGQLRAEGLLASQGGQDTRSVTGAPELQAAPHAVSFIVRYSNSHLLYLTGS